MFICHVFDMENTVTSNVDCCDTIFCNKKNILEFSKGKNYITTYDT